MNQIKMGRGKESEREMGEGRERERERETKWVSETYHLTRQVKLLIWEGGWEG
jgi:hypothetical protein